jgi:predicted phage tail protein
VTWTAPASNGGSAITGYAVRVIRATNNTQVGLLRPAGAGATSLVVTGLTNGTAYRFQVRAINAVGNGPFSAQSASVIPATTPGAPNIGTPTRGPAGGAITATANWNAGTTGGSPITAYRVYAQQMSSALANATPVGSPTVAVVAGSARNATFTFTQANLNIRFRVEAVNAVGTGPKSAASANVVPR